MKAYAAVRMLMTLMAIAANGEGINTPTPIQPGSYPSCEGFYQASPGVSCYNIAIVYRLTLDEFLRLNPQIGSADQCGTKLLAGYWYCVKPLQPGSPPAGNEGQNDIASPKENITPPPQAPSPVCNTDDCWRAFKVAVGQPRVARSVFCSDFLAKPCSAPTMDAVVGVPALAAAQCTQGPACKVLSSACECFLGGSMDLTAA
jgi:hypothetical protein